MWLSDSTINLCSPLSTRLRPFHVSKRKTFRKSFSAVPRGLSYPSNISSPYLLRPQILIPAESKNQDKDRIQKDQAQCKPNTVTKGQGQLMHANDVDDGPG